METVAEHDNSISNGFDDETGPVGTLEEFPDYLIYENGTIKRISTGNYILGNYDSAGYRVVKLFNRDNQRKPKYVHNILMDCFQPTTEKEMLVDHIDRNKRNNNLSNLRWTTATENSRNISKREGCSSKYYGVNFNQNKWIAAIHVNGKTTHIGSYNTEKEAAIAYDKEELIEHPNDLKLNFPRKNYE
jgi:hypothetical protein